jgi:hypothetical protein
MERPGAEDDEGLDVRDLYRYKISKRIKRQKKT